MIAGILTGAGFHARVTAHSVRLEEGEHTNTGSGVGGGGLGGSGVGGGGLDTSGGGVAGAVTVGLLSSASVRSLPPRRDKAVFLVKFSPEVLARDAAMDR